MKRKTAKEKLLESFRELAEKKSVVKYDGVKRWKYKYYMGF